MAAKKTKKLAGFKAKLAALDAVVRAATDAKDLAGVEAAFAAGEALGFAPCDLFYELDVDHEAMSAANDAWDEALDARIAAVGKKSALGRSLANVQALLNQDVTD